MIIRMPSKLGRCMACARASAFLAVVTFALWYGLLDRSNDVLGHVTLGAFLSSALLTLAHLATLIIRKGMAHWGSHWPQESVTRGSHDQ